MNMTPAPVHPRAVQGELKPLPNVRNIIAVGSGKGGVGKSTTSVNLALALAATGARVGILDADVYGPSIPTMLGLTERPQSPDNKSIIPLRAHGIEAMSIGLLVEQDTPMIWRGPMATSALTQLLGDTRWGEGEGLDYLIVDLPPGTGDIQLTLAQKIPVAGAVIVTTPQEVATLDARKALKMFEKVDIATLGLVENMAQHVCSNCSAEAGRSRWPASTGCRCLGRCRWKGGSGSRATPGSRWRRRSLIRPPHRPTGTLPPASSRSWRSARAPRCRFRRRCCRAVRIECAAGTPAAQGA